MSEPIAAQRQHPEVAAPDVERQPLDPRPLRRERHRSRLGVHDDQLVEPGSVGPGLDEQRAVAGTRTARPTRCTTTA